MRSLVSCLFLIAASSTFAQTNRAADVPPPPDLSDVMKANASSSSTYMERTNAARLQEDTPNTDNAVDNPSSTDPDIRIIKKADAIMEEHRFNGKLYMVKVTPKMGQPYYLYDDEGNGTMIRRDDATHIAPPRWTLFSW